MIYIKDNVNFPESVRYFSGHEYMFVLSNGSPKTFNPIKDRPNKWAGTTMHGTDRQKDGTVQQITGKGKEIRPYGMRFNWWKINNKQPDTGHPAPMPFSMAFDHISSWSNEGCAVMDPFMGSGTTGVACVKLGRKFIGIELEPKYFDIACQRITDAYKQPDMFVPAPSNPVQGKIDV
jgi:site-specific DNA-methyltransferase (adenine-specific)